MQVACEVGRGGALAVAAIAGVLGAAALTAATSEPGAPAARGELQGAVDGQGFLVAQAMAHGRRVWAVDRNNGAQRHLAEVVREGDMRIVGTTAGPAAGYQEGRRMRLARITDGHDLGMWGTDVRGLCDGVASNDQRFAVGWLEGAGGMMIVHGPTTRNARDTAASAAELVALDTGITAQPSWCGVASAGDKVALAFRDRDRLLTTLCTAKRCGRLAGSTPMPRTSVVLGMGCVRNACLIAHRDQRGATAVTYVTESGSAKWTKPIVTDATSVSIVGAGANAFAVGLSNRDGSHVLRFDRKGNSTQPWRGSVGAGVPSLAWSAGHLLVAHYTNDKVTPISLRLPD